MENEIIKRIEGIEYSIYEINERLSSVNALYRSISSRCDSLDSAFTDLRNVIEFERLTN